MSSKKGFVSHGFQGAPSYAFPSYAFPSYAFPSYAFPSYAFPSYAFPSYAFPSYAFNDGITSYGVTSWGVAHLFQGIDEDNSYSTLLTTTKYGDAIQIAVLDTGLYAHPELSDSVTWTYDATGQNDMTDVSGHGTHVAGIIDSFGIAEIYAIKVMDGPLMQGEWSWLEEGIYAAINGPDGVAGTKDDADIINMSLGSQGEVPPSYIEVAINTAYSRDIALVASAGNSGDGNINTVDIIQYPAAYDGVIAVGAVDQNNNLASFSNTNPYVEIVAPGVDILSTYNSGEYAVWSGTSMAAPHISALLAFLKYHFGDDSDHDISLGSFTSMWNGRLRGSLHRNALDLGSYGLDNGFGYGLRVYDL